MSVANELTRLINSKVAIKTAIEAKGVSVSAITKLDGYSALIDAIPQGSTGWTPPADWIDISAVNDNEINLLVTEGTGVAFKVKVGTGTGTFSIDWGDGTIDTGLVGNNTTTFQHQHSVNGTPCSQGYNTWKIRIYGASGDITMWKIAKNTYISLSQYAPLLWAVFGTTNITDYSNTFNASSGVTCQILQACTISSFSSVTSTSQMFYYCYSLVSATLPVSWGSVTNTSQMFYNCYSLLSATLPASWGSVTNTSVMFNNCRGLLSIILPASWGSVSNVSQMFYNCYSLLSITLPASWGSISSAASMFGNCSGLKLINNIEYLGSITIQSNFSEILLYAQFMQQSIAIGSLLSNLGIYGTNGNSLKISSIRLTNSGSLFTGTSPQVNVSYTSLDAAALNLLFGDLPTLIGKTINITGCTGAATCTRSIATAKGWTVTG